MMTGEKIDQVKEKLFQINYNQRKIIKMIMLWILSQMKMINNKKKNRKIQKRKDKKKKGKGY